MNGHDSIASRIAARLGGAGTDKLRDYQREQLQEIGRALSDSRRILVQLPTGGGKTHEIAALTQAAVDAGARVLILATRTRLVRQIHERLEAFGLSHGVIAASLGKLGRFSCAVQVASVDTLHRRAVVKQSMPLPAADVVIFDEAHLAAAASRLALLDSYPDAVRVGFTATPARKSGRGLAAAFATLIIGPSIRELTQRGSLVPLRIFSTPAVSNLELNQLPRDNANDYQTAQLAQLLTRPKIVGDVVSNWLRIAAGKRTVCFAVSKAHGAALVEDFMRAGVSAELVTDQDDETSREQAIARLENGSTQVLVNCFLMSYGVDMPSVEAIVVARPTRSLAMFLQMVGRGMRPAPGKANCILIDHGRCVEKLGMPQYDFPWSLDEGRNVNAEAVQANNRRKDDESPRTCPECSSMWLTSEQGADCPNCGWKSQTFADHRAVTAIEADLQEVGGNPARQLTANDSEVAEFFRMTLAWYAKRWPLREKSKAYAWHACRDRFDLIEQYWPSSYWGLQPLPFTPIVAGWLRSRLIRFAKSRAA